MHLILIYINLEDQRDREWQVDESICTVRGLKKSRTSGAHTSLLELLLLVKDSSLICGISEIRHPLKWHQVLPNIS